ncbi:MAG TPA: helix-turn-helix domain-containing protein [Rhizomicrobium sp.]|jgi:DNA-binding IclR family transcriptional regulator
MIYAPTPRAQALLDHLHEQIAANGFAPSLDEMAASLGTAKSAVRRLLLQLENRGHLRVKRTAHGHMRARAIALRAGVMP